MKQLIEKLNLRELTNAYGMSMSVLLVLLLQTQILDLLSNSGN